MSKLTQPKGSVIHEIEIDTISKILGIPHERINICEIGLDVSNIDILINRGGGGGIILPLMFLVLLFPIQKLIIL